MTKLSPQYQAWRARRAEKYAADRQVEHGLTLSEDMEASEGFLAGAEAEHEAAKLVGRIEALEEAADTCHYWAKVQSIAQARLDALLAGGEK